MGYYNSELSARLALGHYKRVGCYIQGGVTIQCLRYGITNRMRHIVGSVLKLW